MEQYLQILSNGWVQETVNAANDIFLKTEHDSDDWETFFISYWKNNPMTPDLKNYLQYPILKWFTARHPVLQPGIRKALFVTITRITQTSDLDYQLENDEQFRDNLLELHKFAGQFGYDGLDDNKNELITFYEKHIQDDFDHYFKASVDLTYDPNNKSYMAILRYEVWMSYIMIDTTRNTEIEQVLGLTGDRKYIWNTYSILLADNKGLEQKYVDTIKMYLALVPKEFHEVMPRSIRVNELLGFRTQNKIGPHASLTNPPTPCTVNIYKDGDWMENQFQGFEVINNQVFLSVLAHELNHVFDWLYVRNDTTLNARLDKLLEDAQCPAMNFLRSQLGDCFFVNSPGEVFASITNQYSADSESTIRLGIHRFNEGYKFPINQALFMADVYSFYTDKTYSFKYVEATKTLTRSKMDIGRTADSRKCVNYIKLGTKDYYFKLGSDYDCPVTEILNEPYCTKPCQNGGTCDKIDHCACINGWKGDQCDIPCNPSCINGENCSSIDHTECNSQGTCFTTDENGIEGYCQCNSGWKGTYCEEKEQTETSDDDKVITTAIIISTIGGICILVFLVLFVLVITSLAVLIVLKKKNRKEDFQDEFTEMKSVDEVKPSSQYNKNHLRQMPPQRVQHQQHQGFKRNPPRNVSRNRFNPKVSPKIKSYGNRTPKVPMKPRKPTLPKKRNYY